MTTPPPDGNQFKKQPRRKSDPGRRVPISAEAREAYEAEIKAQAERQAYLSHLPDRDRR